MVYEEVVARVKSMERVKSFGGCTLIASLIDNCPTVSVRRTSTMPHDDFRGSAHASKMLCAALLTL